MNVLDSEASVRDVIVQRDQLEQIKADIAMEDVPQQCFTLHNKDSSVSNPASDLITGSLDSNLQTGLSRYSDSHSDLNGNCNVIINHDDVIINHGGIVVSPDDVIINHDDVVVSPDDVTVISFDQNCNSVLTAMKTCEMEDQLNPPDYNHSIDHPPADNSPIGNSPFDYTPADDNSVDYTPGINPPGPPSPPGETPHPFSLFDPRRKSVGGGLGGAQWLEAQRRAELRHQKAVVDSSASILCNTSFYGSCEVNSYCELPHPEKFNNFPTGRLSIDLHICPSPLPPSRTFNKNYPDASVKQMEYTISPNLDVTTVTSSVGTAPPPENFPDMENSPSQLRAVSDGVGDFVSKVMESMEPGCVVESVVCIPATLHGRSASLPACKSSNKLDPTNTRLLGSRICIQLVKGDGGLGFSVTTRDNLSGGDCPIYIKNILPRGAAILDGRLKAGDRLLSVDDVEMTGLTQALAVRVLRQIPPGFTVTLTVSRQGDVTTSSTNQITAHPVAAPGNSLPRADLVNGCLPPIAATPEQAESVCEEKRLKRTGSARGKETHNFQPMRPSSASIVSIQNDSGLESSSALKVRMDALRDNSGTVVSSGRSQCSAANQVAGELERLTFNVALGKAGAAGLGITVRRISERGVDLGISIKSVIVGGAVSKDGRIKVDDRLIEINGISLRDIDNSRAIEILKSAMQTNGRIAGFITVTVARSRLEPHVSLKSIDHSEFKIDVSGNKNLCLLDGPNSVSKTSDCHDVTPSLSVVGSRTFLRPAIKSATILQLSRDNRYSGEFTAEESLQKRVNFLPVVSDTSEMDAPSVLRTHSQQSRSSHRHSLSSIEELNKYKFMRNDVAGDRNVPTMRNQSNSSSGVQGDERGATVCTPPPAFCREGFGRRSVSEKRKGHTDPRGTEFFRRVKSGRETSRTEREKLANQLQRPTVKKCSSLENLQLLPPSTGVERSAAYSLTPSTAHAPGLVLTSTTVSTSTAVVSSTTPVRKAATLPRSAPIPTPTTAPTQTSALATASTYTTSPTPTANFIHATRPTPTTGLSHNTRPTPTTAPTIASTLPGVGVEVVSLVTSPLRRDKPRHCGSNESFRAAVEESYEASVTTAHNVMQTVREDGAMERAVYSACGQESGHQGAPLVREDKGRWSLKTFVYKIVRQRKAEDSSKVSRQNSSGEGAAESSLPVTSLNSDQATPKGAKRGLADWRKFAERLRARDTNSPKLYPVSPAIGDISLRSNGTMPVVRVRAMNKKPTNEMQPVRRDGKRDGYGSYPVLDRDNPVDQVKPTNGDTLARNGTLPASLFKEPTSRTSARKSYVNKNCSGGRIRGCSNKPSPQTTLSSRRVSPAPPSRLPPQLQLVYPPHMRAPYLVRSATERRAAPPDVTRWGSQRVTSQAAPSSADVTRCGVERVTSHASSQSANATRCSVERVASSHVVRPSPQQHGEPGLQHVPYNSGGDVSNEAQCGASVVCTGGLKSSGGQSRNGTSSRMDRRRQPATSFTFPVPVVGRSSSALQQQLGGSGGLGGGSAGEGFVGGCRGRGEEGVDKGIAMRIVRREAGVECELLRNNRHSRSHQVLVSRSAQV